MKDCGPVWFSLLAVSPELSFHTKILLLTERASDSYPILFFNKTHHIRFMKCLLLAFCSCSLVVFTKDYNFASNVGFLGGASGKEPTCQCRRHKRPRLDPWVRKIPWMRACQPTPVSLPGESHRQRRLVGYGP